MQVENLEKAKDALIGVYLHLNEAVEATDDVEADDVREVIRQKEQVQQMVGALTTKVAKMKKENA